MKRRTKAGGAGGNWKRFNERFDASIVKQREMSCVSAVGEMLLRERGIIFPQQRLIKAIGSPTSLNKLAKYFNTLTTSTISWLGGYFDPDNVKSLDVIIASGSWGAVLREGYPLGHAVLVEGVDEKGFFLIKDPFDQTSYRMTEKDFLDHLSEFICEQ